MKLRTLTMYLIADVKEYKMPQALQTKSNVVFWSKRATKLVHVKATLNILSKTLKLNKVMHLQPIKYIISQALL